jgi:membrane protease subunit HflC
MQRLAPILLLVIVALALLSGTIFVVDQRQYAVVYALGEIRQVIEKPGLHFKLPPPFQNVQYFDRRILLNIQVDTYVKWRIADPRTFVRSVQGSELIASDRITRSLRDALNNEIAKRTVADVISGERAELIENVRSKVNDDARQIGAEVIGVQMKRVDFAPEVAERVYDRMQSERKQVANERRATGSAESEKIRADADRQREVILANAYRDAQKIKGEGDARAAAAYASAFGQNPEFAEFYRSLEAYRASFRNRTDVLVVDPSAEFFRYFKGSAAPAR